MKKEPESVQSPASSSFSGCGPRKQSKVAEEAAAPSMKLGIGTGVPAMKEEKRHLTAEQQDEFQRQVSIYRYIAAGVPVPSTLVRPIRKSVSVDDSFRFLKSASGIHRQHPSFVGFSKECDYINTINPEPDRCRRTDGKKWRCRKNVIDGQKYCQQHMHRGRARSRKPVESSRTSNVAPMNQPRKISENPNTSSFYATIPSNTSIYHKNSVPTSKSVSNVDFKIMGTKMIPSRLSCPKSISTTMIPKETMGLRNAAAIMTTSTVHTDSTVTTATIGAGKGSNNNCYKRSSIDDMNRNGSTYATFKNQIDQGNAHRNLKNANVCTSQKLSFSPNSVLQVQGGNLGCLSRSGELEPGRCRRTDGKKWRCRRDVVPDEKYCKMHMHRGAKKRVLAYASPPHTTTSSGLNRSAMLPSNVYTSNLNTNLSISITANPRLQTKDETNTSRELNTTISSSSDTISDALVANCDYKDVTS